MHWSGLAIGLVQFALAIFFLSQRHKLSANSGKGTTPKLSTRFYLGLGVVWLLLAAVTFAAALS